MLLLVEHGSETGTGLERRGRGSVSTSCLVSHRLQDKSNKAMNRKRIAKVKLSMFEPT